MAAHITRWSGDGPTAEDIEGRFRDDGLHAHAWSNEPDYRYSELDHSYHRVLYCLRGSITFHVRDEDLGLGPGDRIDLDPRTAHAATVGPDGVTCMEASRQG
jgi:quercetin dioxygenase-like cupin family protein